jgi:hypothetical protein
MPFPRLPRTGAAAASVVAAVGLMVTLASCAGHITPLGPEPTPSQVGAAPLPPPRQLGSPIILHVMRSHPAGPGGACPAGKVAVAPPQGAAMPCYRSAGLPVTITSAAVSPVSPIPTGQPGPATYGFIVAVTAAETAAVTAVIKQAFDSKGSLGISVGGKLWAAPEVLEPFSGQQLQIALLNRNQARQLYGLLVPAG